MESPVFELPQSELAALKIKLEAEYSAFAAPVVLHPTCVSVFVREVVLHSFGILPSGVPDVVILIFIIPAQEVILTMVIYCFIADQNGLSNHL